ncbi:MAG: c-type cytochrome [Pirellulales bacterium]|nr:c-type cytochrome [Pirellulales bacterium]
MPATDKTVRDIKKMHVTFAVTSVVLVLSTVWMFWKDHDRPWKEYQKEARAIDLTVSQWRLMESQTADVLGRLEVAKIGLENAKGSTTEGAEVVDEFLEFLGKTESLKAAEGDPEASGAMELAALITADFVKDLEDAKSVWQRDDEDRQPEERIAAREAMAFALSEAVRLLKAKEDKILSDTKFKRANRDETASQLGIAFSANDKDGQSRLKDKLEEILENPSDGLNAYELKYEKATYFRRQLAAIANKFQASVRESQKALDEVNADKVRLNDAISTSHSALWEGKWLGKAWLELPILDAFNGPLDIDNLWSDDLEQDYNFKKVRRFDRCTTCHQMMEKSVPGQATEPGFVSDRMIEIVLQVPPTALQDRIGNDGSVEADDEGNPLQELRPIGGKAQERQQSLAEYGYGLRFSPRGLYSADDVTISYVAPNSVAKKAEIVEALNLDEEFSGEEILKALLQSETDASPIKNSTLARHTRAGLEVGDVIVSVDGDPVVNPDVVAARLLDVQQDASKTELKLVVRRGIGHPFASHPRLDLFVGSLSPHKVSDFACTICHEGQGSATEFKWASHMPDSELDRKRWMEEHGWFDNHHWIYPQHPKRFIESTCLKCHHDVTELEPSLRFPEAPAPKVVRGYNTIRKFGCYGCHEMNGYSGADKRVGPYLRLEPNYFAAALQLQSQEGFGELGVESMEFANRLVSHPEDNQARYDLVNVLRAVIASPEPKIDTAESNRLIGVLADIEAPGSLRKSGPSLRYLSKKNSDKFLYDWIANPQNFRPSSRMPRFFNLHSHFGDNKSDDDAKKFEKVEILGMVEYLKAYSQEFDYLSPSEGVQGDVARGKVAFQERGCLACHSHNDPQLAEIEKFRPEGEWVQGPDLSDLGGKFAGFADADKWLYSWIKEPTKYHARTVMPNLYIDEEVIKDSAGDDVLVDPVLDIVTYLLGEGSEWHVADEDFSLNAVKEGGELGEALEDLLLVNLTDSFYDAVAKEYAKNGIPLNATGIKVSEEELRRDTSSPLSIDTKLVYIGRKALGKYGCYACHDIPGFEDAKPIGAGLADWGRKDPSKLDFGHIAKYLENHHTHGQETDAHAGSAHSEETSEITEGNAHGSRDVRPNRYDDELSDFYHHQLHAHNRTGFIYQKLREPRSYDYHKTDGIRYNDRLRMPLFPFSTEDREAVITFVLGLIADPPRTKYLYQPDSRAKALIEGKQVIDKYNCAGCHILEAEKWTLDMTEDQLGTLLAQHVDLTKEYPFMVPPYSQEEIDAASQPNDRDRTVGTIAGMPTVGNSGLASATDAEFGDPIDEYLEDPFQLKGVGELQFQLWAASPLKGGIAASGSNVSRIQPAAVANRSNAYGGVLSRYLLPYVTQRERLSNPQAKGSESWAWVAPPLVGEGAKVQNQWFHDFLLEPYSIRPAVVLRMPKFNMSSDEATKIVNYFAARDNAIYPYEHDYRVNGDHLAEADAAYVNRNEGAQPGDRLADAMQIVVSQDYCVKCHAVADFMPNGTPKGLAPDLGLVHKRLRADYVKRWIAKPNAILPYTAMPVIVPYDSTQEHLGAIQTYKLFHGNSPETVNALVDLLMNFDNYAKDRASVAKLVEEAKAAKEAAAAAAAAASEE